MGADLDLDLSVAHGFQKFHQDLQQQHETYVAVEEETRKTMSKGQRRFLEQSVQEIQASDVSLWATLTNKKSQTPLPRGCKVFLMEIFAGAAVLTSMAMTLGLPVAAPIDIKLDGTDLLDPKVRSEIESHIEQMDPYCVTFARWSRLNLQRGEQTRGMVSMDSKIKCNDGAMATTSINLLKVDNAPDLLNIGHQIFVVQSSMDSWMICTAEQFLQLFMKPPQKKLSMMGAKLGSVDYIYDDDDLSRDPILPQRVDGHELQRLEALEEAPSPPDLMELEATRKFKWLRSPRETRVAIRRLHHMIGHGSNSATLQLLRTAGGVPKSSVGAETLLNGWFQPFGPPHIFTCDRGVHNRGRVQDLLRIHGVLHRYGALEAPYQIGRSERQANVLKEVLKGAIEERQIIGVKDMKMLIAESTTVKNWRVNHHGFTPAQWVLGRLPTDSTSITAEEAEGYALGVHAELMEPEEQFARQLEIRQAAKMRPYAPGDLICFHRKGRWHGPARIVGRDGRSTFWVIHAGIPIVVAENQIRPATSSEVMVKQILELWPSRKRKRDIAKGADNIPFHDDLVMPHMQHEEDQPSYLELPYEPGAQGGPTDFPANPPPGLDLPMEMAAPPGLDLDSAVGAPPEAAEPQQPESERAPTSVVPTVPSTPAMEQGHIPQLGLHESLRRSVNDLDGHHLRSMPPPTSTARRERSRSPHREAGNIPVPRDDQQVDDAEDRQARHFLAFLARRNFDVFLAKRAAKKKRQVGAGRELNYGKSMDDVKKALDQTRLKEWNSWKQFEAAKICKKRRLRGGDISAAFLQGTRIKRKRALKLPSDGIPDDDIEPGSLLKCEKSVYGTCDAPPGFWKGLYNTLLECGLKEVPMETSAYYLPGAEGEVLGLLGTHVDDLLWCGTPEMDNVMQKVQERYKFRITNAEDSEDGVFKFCGRMIHQTDDGVTITSPGGLDRVKAIYIEPMRRKQKGLPASPSEISQLRSVNQLQSVQQRARVEDLTMANRLLNYALETKDRGVHFPSGAFEFEDAAILSINDASRLLALSSKEFLETGKGKIHVLQWSSTVIKRVCTSTMQAETLSLQLGSEDAEHMRQLMYIVKNKSNAMNRTENFIGALDETVVGWFTDCRSLSDHLSNVNAAAVSDKRLAIDLTSLRQELWRERGQLVGNPTYCDALPADRTTTCRWVATTSIPADSLTKHMKSPQLDELMTSGAGDDVSTKRAKFRPDRKLRDPLDDLKTQQVSQAGVLVPALAAASVVLCCVFGCLLVKLRKVCKARAKFAEMHDYHDSGKSGKKDCYEAFVDVLPTPAEVHGVHDEKLPGDETSQHSNGDLGEPDAKQEGEDASDEENRVQDVQEELENDAKQEGEDASDQENRVQDVQEELENDAKQA
eukprot:s140_g51.t2